VLSCETPACFYKSKHLEDGYASNNSLVDIEIPGLTLNNHTATNMQQDNRTEKNPGIIETVVDDDNEKKVVTDFEISFSKNISDCTSTNVIKIDDDDDDNTQDSLVVSVLPGNIETTITSPPCVSNATRIETSTPHVASGCGETKRHFLELKQKLNNDSPITRKDKIIPTVSATFNNSHHNKVIADSPPPEIKINTTHPGGKRKNVDSTTESISSDCESAEYSKTPRRQALHQRKRARRGSDHSQQSITIKSIRKKKVSETSQSSDGEGVSESDTLPLYQGSPFYKSRKKRNTSSKPSSLIESPPVCSGSWLSKGFQKQKSPPGLTTTPTRNLPKKNRTRKSKSSQKLRNPDVKALLKSGGTVNVSSSESDEW
jgi:hypothetical protein